MMDSNSLCRQASQLRNSKVRLAAKVLEAAADVRGTQSMRVGSASKYRTKKLQNGQLSCALT